MTPRPLLPLALSLATLATLAACSGAPVAGQRSPDCALEFLRKAPQRPYDELGSLLEHVVNVPPGGALEAVRPRACAMGADAFIVEREQVLNYLGHTLVEGQAIRWKVEPAPQVQPAAAPEPKPSP